MKKLTKAEKKKLTHLIHQRDDKGGSHYALERYVATLFKRYKENPYAMAKRSQPHPNRGDR